MWGTWWAASHEMAPFDTLTMVARSGIDKFQEYRTSLISAAVTGQIDVCDEVATHAKEDHPWPVS